VAESIKSLRFVEQYELKNPLSLFPACNFYFFLYFRCPNILTSLPRLLPPPFWVFPKKSFSPNDVRIVCSSLIFQRFFSQFSPSPWFFICISASSLCFSPQLLLTHTNMQLFVACFSGKDSAGGGRKNTPTNYVNLSVNEISFGHCVSCWSQSLAGR